MTLAVKLDITQLFQHASDRYQQHDYAGALRLFYQAWVKLPKPKDKQSRDEQPQNEQLLAGEILTAIGSTYFQLQRYEPAIEALRSAMEQAAMSSNPLTLLRLGQCLLDSGQEAQGRTYLQRAYRLGGANIFTREDDRYMSAITDLVE
ncbi:MAG: tetratricopeptide (TPR) repeat protein [Kiritimatiellia bacterium]|jgi:tetratricopeptide (TPR) repeat protein